MYSKTNFGIAAPIQEDGNSIEPLSVMQVSRREHISQSLKMILSTRPGTRPLEMDYGCRIHELLFKPITPSLIARVQFFVEQSIKRWEGDRVNLHDIEIRSGEGIEMLGQLTIRVHWSESDNPRHKEVLEVLAQDGQLSFPASLNPA